MRLFLSIFVKKLNYRLSGPHSSKQPECVLPNKPAAQELKRRTHVNPDLPKPRGSCLPLVRVSASKTDGAQPNGACNLSMEALREQNKTRTNLWAAGIIQALRLAASSSNVLTNVFAVMRQMLNKPAE